MRILLVNDYAEPIGGAEVYVQTIQSAFAAAGHSVELFTSNVAKREYLRSVNSRSLCRLIRRLFNLKSLVRFSGVMRRFRPDVVHVHGYHELSPSFLLACKSTPVILTIHDHRIVSAVINPQCGYSRRHGGVCPGCIQCVGWKGSLYERLRQYIHRRMLKRVSHYIAPSRPLARQLEQFSHIRPLSVIPNGIFLPEPRPFHHSHRILYIGRLSESKGVQYLIDAMRWVRDSIPSARLEIVGDGEYGSRLRERVRKLDLESVITFTPSLEHDKALLKIGGSSIVCMPSVWEEPLPLVTIEAMAMGRVLVASRVGGIAEAVEDGVSGVLVEPGNARAIAETIITLLNNPARTAKLSAHAIKAAQKYDIHIHINSLLHLYERHRAHAPSV